MTSEPTDTAAFLSADKRDWYAGIRKWLSKQHPVFEYDYKWQPH